MRYLSASSICGIATMVLVIGWSDVQQAAAQTHAPAAGAPSTGPAAAAPAAQGGITGTVVETMNAGQYTYVQVDDGAKKIWAAAPQFAVAVGDKVVVPDGMPMRDFQSKTLGRTFDLVYFVSAIEVVGAGTANGKVAAAHGPADAAGHGPTGDGAAAPHGAAGQGVPAR